jgi:hypothetical protein
MPFKVTYLFQYGIQGYSESWYTSLSGSAPLIAAEYALPSVIGPYTIMKGGNTIVQAVRVSDLSTPRNAFLQQMGGSVVSYQSRSLNSGGIAGDSLLTDLFGSSNGRRSFLYRGLGENLSDFDNDGNALFSATFQFFFTQWLTFISQNNRFQIRFQTPPGVPPATNVPMPIVSVGPNVTSPQQSVINVVLPAGYTPPPFGRIVVHGLPRRLFPGWTGSIPYSYAANQLFVPIIWNYSAGLYAPAKASAVVSLFGYNTIGGGEYRDFRTRKVGRPFGAARGRRSGVRYRGV